jgi:hypothetical protein
MTKPLWDVAGGILKNYEGAAGLVAVGVFLIIFGLSISQFNDPLGRVVYVLGTLSIMFGIYSAAKKAGLKI